MRRDKSRPLLLLARQSLDTNWLHRWWCRKYNLPRTDHRYAEHTEEELLLEYFEDLWEHEPIKAMDLLGDYEPDVVLETGDTELDEIERRLARGEDPDEVLKGWGDGEGSKTEEAPDEIDDDYL